MCLIFSFFHEGICQATGRKGGLLLQYQEKFGILSLKTKRARRCKISQVKKKTHRFLSPDKNHGDYLELMFLFNYKD